MACRDTARVSSLTSRAYVIGFALVAIALLPFLVAVVTRAGRETVPVGDIALMDLRVRDVWSSEVPLVGAYSRFGWNHPGPAAYFLIAPISALSGTAAWGSLVGNVLVQAATVAAIAYVAWRIGQLSHLVAVLALVGLAYGAMGPSVMLEAWNPHLAYPLFMLFVLLAWVLALGKPRALVFAAISASVLVQAHIGYLPLVLVAGVCALGFAIARTGRSWIRWKRATLWTAVAVVACWIPPIVHEFVHESNVERLTESLTDAGEPTLGAGEAARILAEEFRLPPPWLGGEHRLDPVASTVVGASAAWLVIPVGLLAAGWIASTVRRRRGSVELLAIATALSFAGFVALTRVIGDAERYVFYWRVPLALLIVFSSVWCVWIALGLDRIASAVGIAFAGGTLVILVAAVTLSVRIAQVDRISDSEHTARAAITATTNDVPRDGAVLVRATDTPFIGVQRALVNELDRDGVDVRVDDGLGFMFGYGRTASPEDTDTVWYVSEGGQYTSLLSDAPGARELWSTTPLTPAEEQELREKQRELAATLQDAGRNDLIGALQSSLIGFNLAGIPGVDPATASRVAELNAEVEAAGSCRCSIIAFAPDDVPAAVARVAP